MLGWLAAGFFLWKWLGLKHALRRLKEEWSACSASETNRRLPVVASDASLRALTDALNDSLETIRKERLRLDRRARWLNEQMGTIAHDLRTPLTAALGYTQLFWQENDERQRQEDVRVVEGRLRALQAMSEELFEFARLQDGANPLALTEVRVDHVLEETIVGMRALLQKKQIELSLDLNPMVVTGNAPAMARVFTNLLANAVKYAPDGITIAMIDERTVVFENGLGALRFTDVEKLFERYATLRFHDDSHGLGLPIARDYMEKMGGSLVAEVRDGVIRFACRFSSPDSRSKSSRRRRTSWES